jgi:hypothetical protein
MITAEAKIRVRAWGEMTWTDALELDPIEIPVLETQPGTNIPVLTDPRDSRVISLVETLEMAEADSDDTMQYSAVWSDFGFEVKVRSPEGDVVSL